MNQHMDDADDAPTQCSFEQISNWAVVGLAVIVISTVAVGMVAGLVVAVLWVCA